MSSLRALAVVALVPALVLNLAGCGNGGGWTPPPPPVNVMTVASADVPMSFVYAGRVSDSRQVEVRARVAGTLVKRAYVEGARVNRGEVLFLIDPAQLQADAKAANAQLAEARSLSEQAERDATRTEELFGRGLVSVRERDLALSQRDQARAAWQRAQAEADRRSIDLGYTRVTAPVSGITSVETRPEGSYVSPQMEESLLTTITQVDPAVVDFSVSESDNLRLRTLMSSGRLLGPKRGGGVAKLVLNGGVPYAPAGKVEYLDIVIDPRTGTLLGRAQFANPDLDLLPGQFVRVVLEGYTLKNAIVVPEKAVMQGSEGAFVYVVDKDAVAHMRTVRLGLPLPGGRAIDDGLKVGEKVIIDNLVKVMPEQKVELPADKPPAAQPATAKADNGGAKGG